MILSAGKDAKHPQLSYIASGNEKKKKSKATLEKFASF